MLQGAKRLSMAVKGAFPLSVNFQCLAWGFRTEFVFETKAKMQRTRWKVDIISYFSAFTHRDGFVATSAGKHGHGDRVQHEKIGVRRQMC